MFIQTQETPNPNSIKFIPGVRVLESGTASFASGEEISSSPLAAALCGTKGIEGVFFTEFFITVTKGADEDWAVLRPYIFATIMDHFNSGKPVLTETKGTAQVAEQDDEIVRQIKDIIEEHIRPAVQGDGGNIVFHSFVDGTVYVELHGACSGCPSSAITLQHGIENLLRYYVPEVIKVEQVQAEE